MAAGAGGVDALFDSSIMLPLPLSDVILPKVSPNAEKSGLLDIQSIHELLIAFGHVKAVTGLRIYVLSSV